MKGSGGLGNRWGLPHPVRHYKNRIPHLPCSRPLHYYSSGSGRGEIDRKCFKTDCARRGGDPVNVRHRSFSRALSAVLNCSEDFATIYSVAPIQEDYLCSFIIGTAMPLSACFAEHPRLTTLCSEVLKLLLRVVEQADDLFTKS